MKDLLVLTTGGTIDKVYFDAKSEYQVGTPVAASILAAMQVGYNVSCVEICRKDSLELTDEDRQNLKQTIEKSNANLILITHGTDTMIETAQFIGSQKDKVIVFTGAMQPAIFKETDGLFNLGTALGIVSSAQPGVYIAMNGCCFSPLNAVKNYDTRVFEEKKNLS